MKTKRVLFGTLAATAATFFLGWGIYGAALNDYFSTNMVNPAARPEQEMVMWAMVLSTLMSGLLLTLIIEWSGHFTAMSGARMGGITGVLMALSYDLGQFSMTTMYLTKYVILVDSIACGVMYAIAGAIAGWVMQKTGATSVAAA